MALLGAVKRFGMFRKKDLFQDIVAAPRNQHLPYILSKKAPFKTSTKRFFVWRMHPARSFSQDRAQLKGSPVVRKFEGTAKEFRRRWQEARWNPFWKYFLVVFLCFCFFVMFFGSVSLFSWGGCFLGVIFWC